ncbi:MAG: ORF6N domain-containing protein, partial [Candidatus Omnitrophota bacterium]|nr:ORF6N domain-containing protein [Candidatus Omnitrophota bacterium]
IQDYLCTGNMGYFQRLNNKSRMSREAHVRFCESIEGKFLFATRLMFQLTKEEFENWKSQFATSNQDKMGLRRRPYVFTEQGVAMLSSVLNSERAIRVNIAIMRAFVKLKQILSMNKELAYKLAELERKIEKHDEDIQAIFEAIRQLMAPPPIKPNPQIGFHSNR